MRYRCAECGECRGMPVGLGVGLPACGCGAPPCEWMPAPRCPVQVRPVRFVARPASVRYELAGGQGGSLVGSYSPLAMLADLRAQFGARLVTVHTGLIGVFHG
jgi:hypothetical protein